MACAVIIRLHDGFQSYLVLDVDDPREMLRHWGFPEEFSIRPWVGSLNIVKARDAWSEMLGEDPENYIITDEENRTYCLERSFWDHCKKWPEI